MKRTALPKRPNKNASVRSPDETRETAFAEAVRIHLRKLGWDQSSLIEEAQAGFEPHIHFDRLGWKRADALESGNQVISPSNIYKLIPAKGDGPRPTRQIVCRIAWLIASGYERAHLSGRREAGLIDLGDLDSILNGLLRAAGYTAIHGAPAGSSLDRIEKSKALRVGWFRWGYFAKENFEGPSREITDWVCRLMKINTLEHREIQLSEIENVLDRRDVDIVAPFIILPGRTLRARTIPIPLDTDLKTGLNAIIHRDYFETVVGSANAESFEDLVSRPGAQNVRLNLVHGGVSELVLPDFQRRQRNPMAPEYHPNIAAAQEHVLRHPKCEVTGAVRIFIADQFICHAAALQDQTRAKKLLEKAQFTMPLAFGVNGSEEKLAQDIAACVDFLRMNKVINGIVAGAEKVLWGNHIQH